MRGPIVVGGVGGSGTRVVAQLLLDLDVDLGNDLNVELDDRWFNLLFYRPTWLPAALGDGVRSIDPGLDLMRKRSLGDHRMTARERSFVVCAWRDAVATGHFGGRHRATRRRRASTVWTVRRLTRFMRSAPVQQSNRRGWGWKEPISHLVARPVVTRFPDARYIHVIRHGLDMAFSGNRRQVTRFGPILGLDAPRSRPDPPDILRYWIRANRRVLDIVRSAAPARSHVVVFDDLCRTPEQEIGRLLDFLEIPVTRSRFSALCAVPEVPESLGRYRSQDLSIFEPSDIDEVSRLGFSV